MCREPNIGGEEDWAAPGFLSQSLRRVLPLAWSFFGDGLVVGGRGLGPPLFLPCVSWHQELPSL